MKYWRAFCLWLVMDSGIPLGRLAPHVFHMGMPGNVTMRKIR